MGIDLFCYKLWYNSFPINPINLKLIGYFHTIVINIYANFEVTWIKLYFMSNVEMLVNL